MNHIVRALTAVMLFVTLLASSAYDVLLLGDTHYDSRELKPDTSKLQEYQLNEHKRNLTRWAAEIPRLLQKAGVASASCQFAVQLGDLVQGDFNRQDIHSFALMQAREKVFSNMKCKTFFVRGNHDHRGKGGADAYKQTMLPWLDQLYGIPHYGKSANYAFMIGQDLFVFFDCIEPNITFVEDTFKKYPCTRYTFFLTHIPVLPCSTGEATSGVVYAKDLAKRKTLMQLLAQRNAIVLAAHTHKPSFVKYQFPYGTAQQLVTFSMPTPNQGAFQRHDTTKNLSASLNAAAAKAGPDSAMAQFRDAFRHSEHYRPVGGFAILHINETGVTADLYYGNLDKPTTNVKLQTRIVPQPKPALKKPAPKKPVPVQKRRPVRRKPDRNARPFRHF